MMTTRKLLADFWGTEVGLQKLLWPPIQRAPPLLALKWQHTSPMWPPPHLAPLPRLPLLSPHQFGLVIEFVYSSDSVACALLLERDTGGGGRGQRNSAPLG